MQDALEHENAKLRDIHNKKRKLFLDDIQRQLEDKERQREHIRNMGDQEDENIKRKMQMDEDDYRNKMFRKKEQMQEYLDDIMGQKEAQRQKKDMEMQKEKEFKNTGYQLPEKHEPCYNCARCKRLYPLRNLNKKKYRIKL